MWPVLQGLSVLWVTLSAGMTCCSGDVMPSGRDKRPSQGSHDGSPGMARGGSEIPQDLRVKFTGTEGRVAHPNDSRARF